MLSMFHYWFLNDVIFEIENEVLIMETRNDIN